MLSIYTHCHCGKHLEREYSGPDDVYVCCPSSHYEEGHICYLEGDYTE